MKCGIVGLPNVGKSTLFNALTQTALAEAANYPFCTIEPNIGTVCVPDPRLHQLALCASSATVIPTQLTFMDIAGLVRGASKGEGLGNQFLNHIRNVDAIVHVVRCFQDEQVIHVEGSINPLSDIQTIETELILADLESVERRLEKKKPDPYHDLLVKALHVLEKGYPARSGAWTPSDIQQWPCLGLLTLKPMVYVCNVSEDGQKDQPLAQVVQAYAAERNSPCVVVCNQIEAELSCFDEEERKAYLEQMGQSETGLAKIIRSAYQTLDLQTYFTVGPKEARAWTIPVNATAFDAAGCIHTDFQRGFIRAEVVSFQDYVTYKTYARLKEEGKVRLEGKDYIVADGDVIVFRFNV
jgi:GTP-binding protein YchF